MEKVVIRCAGYPTGEPCPSDGLWVEECDHEAHNGQGEVIFTDNPDKALAFGTLGEAMEFYHRVPECRPLREDGQPNRPLTAMNAVFEKIEESSLH